MLVGRRHRFCFENELLTIWQSNRNRENRKRQETVKAAEDINFPANNLSWLAGPGKNFAKASDDESEELSEAQ
jgi:hypothetical protein